MTLVEVEVPRESADATPPEQKDAPPTREVRHEYTHSLPPLLSQLGVSLLVSTYQAGKVVAVGVASGELTLSYHNFERVMGLAVKPDGIAVAARAQVWFLHAAPDLAARVEPAGRHDACFLTRSSHFTGEIQVHELAWGLADSTPATQSPNHPTEPTRDVWIPMPLAGEVRVRGNSGWSTRPSVACARSMAGTASCRAGGRRSSQSWRLTTAVT